MEKYIKERWTKIKGVSTKSFDIVSKKKKLKRKGWNQRNKKKNPAGLNKKSSIKKKIINNQNQKEFPKILKLKSIN